MNQNNAQPAPRPLPLAGAIILAGGTARRLGGVSKPDYKVAGKRLIDLLFAELESAGFTGVPVVVAPPQVTVPPGTRLVLEDPPHGGPLAGIAAGVAALSDLPDEALVALATCDAPLAPRLYWELLAGVDDGDGAVPVRLSDTSWLQFVHGLYRLGALRHLAMPHNGAIRAAFGALTLSRYVDTEEHCLDVDTPDDAQRLSDRLTGNATS